MVQLDPTLIKKKMLKRYTETVIKIINFSLTTQIAHEKPSKQHTLQKSFKII